MLLAIGLAAASAPAGAGPCDPWPGEPTPLPSLDDSDPLRAEWASLRVRELSALATRVEPNHPLRAQQLWRRVLCIDPANDAALGGVLRSRSVRVHRPALVDAPVEQAPVRDPWEALGAPIAVGADARAADAARAPGAPPPVWGELRGELASLEEHVRHARFAEALERAPALRSRLASAPAGATRSQLIARAEVLAATAELALGRGEAAEASLRRALRADPNLSLDPATTSPKVLRALESARRRSNG